MLPFRDRSRRTRSHPFHGANPEVTGSEAGTHDLILPPPEPIGSECRLAGGAW
jgi:hypothetical protein